LKNPASIGSILYLGKEKIRGRTRLKWLIGNRVVKRAQELIRLETDLQNQLSAGIGEIPDKVKQLIEEIENWKQGPSRPKPGYQNQAATTLLLKPWIIRKSVEKGWKASSVKYPEAPLKRQNTGMERPDRRYPGRDFIRSGKLAEKITIRRP